MTKIMLVGNPNCGKTTLFNCLTGSNQQVGNWPGVTVEKKTGIMQIQDKNFELIDLPGIYSFISTNGSLDEQITLNAIMADEVDIIMNIIDASHLERHLYLTSQLLELGKPMVVVLNMHDVAKLHGIEITIKKLEALLKCPVVAIQAHKAVGIEDLQQIILKNIPNAEPLHLNLPDHIQDELQQLNNKLIHEYSKGKAWFMAFRMLEGSCNLSANPTSNCDMDILIADLRYSKIHEIVLAVQRKKSDTSDHFTAKLDRIVLHKIWGLPIFFTLMYLMFLFAIKIGGAFQDFFDISTEAIFVYGSANLLGYLSIPAWLIALISNGIGKGINTTLTFIPVLAAMYFILAFFEASGYMTRAAFVMDKIMRMLGLPGKAFVPLIVGFGCNVPAIMAARTLDSEKDRLLTILISPFMSCSARLAIYAVFVAAFFPSGGQNIVFSLYLLGLIAGVLTGFLLKKTLLSGESSPLILELPTYHIPSFKRLCKETGFRLRYFIVRAAKVIIPVATLLGFLNSINIHGNLIDTGDSTSVLALLGQWLTPIFYPLGIHAENWPATVSLISGMLAKEVVIGSLNTLYVQIDTLREITNSSISFLNLMQNAFLSIPQNLYELVQSFLHPFTVVNATSPAIYGSLVKYFDGEIGAYAYLLFILLYIPCVSTMAVIKQEANNRLMWFSISWSLLIAYSSSVIFYQLATFTSHPKSSLMWFLGLLVILITSVKLLYIYRNSSDEVHKHVATNS